MSRSDKMKAKWKDPQWVAKYKATIERNRKLREEKKKTETAAPAETK